MATKAKKADAGEMSIESEEASKMIKQSVQSEGTEAVSKGGTAAAGEKAIESPELNNPSSGSKWPIRR
nr:hypothetical protein [Methylomarinum sp. Ch1-1]MDP4522326.1 hypothetical protein [Methylomarinum sp. Ch1-1]